MWIEAEPADFFMMRISLLFSRVAPEPEDAWIREYLTEQGLEPRRTLDLEREGEPIEVLQFGQCYLGRHLRAVQALRRRGLERSALWQAVPRILTEAGYAVPAPPEPDPAGPPNELIAEIAERIHPQTEFLVTKEERVGIRVEPAVVIAAYQAVTGAAAAPAVSS